MTLTTFSTSQEAQQAAALLVGYRFDLGSHDARQWVSLWLESYRPAWIRDAVIESLYQGRYKALSVRQILELWQRRGNPIRHATREFEVAICQDYGGHKLALTAPVDAHINQTSPIAKPAPNLLEAQAKQRASRRIHRSLSSISFNITDQANSSPANSSPANSSAPYSADSKAANSTVSEKVSHIENPPKKVLIETAETLQAQKQQRGTTYGSHRAIQPFKPALPFSAQTLRLAKQKAFATAE